MSNLLVQPVAPLEADPRIPRVAQSIRNTDRDKLVTVLGLNLGQRHQRLDLWTVSKARGSLTTGRFTP